MTATVPPGLPEGRVLDLGARGRGFARVAADATHPPLLMVHGWTVTADTNFALTFPHLADRFRVLAPDLRGHGRGPEARGGERLEDLADDCAAALDAVGVERAVVVGYSLGGAVAQALWRRHPDRVAGLVLCSTARHFQTGPVGDLWYRGQGWLAPLVSSRPDRARARMQRSVDAKVTDGPYAEWFRTELLRSDPAGLLRVGAALGRFRSNAWIGQVDVPTSVVVTTGDRTVPPGRQRGLASAIPGASVHEVDGPHNAVVTRHETWTPALLRALGDVTGSTEEATATPG